MEKEMTVQTKREVSGSGEPTKPVLQFVPAVEIYETAEAVTVNADMPGVDKSGVDIHLEDGVLTIKGIMPEEKSEGQTVLLREYHTGNYVRRFSISEVIDQENIAASMANGVLSIVLPKAKPAQPRRIEVRAG